MNNRKKPGALERFGLTEQTLPRHVAIIMDGNGRWAQKRLLPRSAGHRAGVVRLNGLIRTASDLGLEALTLYAFSTENWKRPREEVSALCGLFVEFFEKEFDELHENGVIIRCLGDASAFPARVFELIKRAEERTRNNDGLTLCIAMNYGSKDELLRAVNACITEGTGPVTEEQFESHLYTAGVPDVDLLIRTGGEQRLSNFLLYQSAYAELSFVNEYWPDFSDEAFVNVLKDYGTRSRRYGGL